MFGILGALLGMHFLKKHFEKAGIGGKRASRIIEYRMVPLMTCCVNIGEELSAAALTRGLGGNVERTNICKIGFCIQDYASIVICIIPWALLIMDVII